MLARHNNLALLLRRLMELSEEFGVAIVLTNQVADQVSSEIEPDFEPESNTRKPIGGYINGKAATTRLSLSKAFGDVRYCEVYGSVELPVEKNVWYP